jgi:N-acetylmuramoyl-L-alanine amidase
MMLRILLRSSLPACVIVSLAGCQEPREPVDPMIAVGTIIEAPDDYAVQRIGTDEWPIPPYAKYLDGVRICLDPGHGGDAHKRAYKRGPTGVREAEVNLRVANYLRDWLRAVGAEVRLTREADVDSSLAERAEVANRWSADLFISLHHNAIGKPDVNRTAVFKHVGVDYRPANLDLARYLCQGLMHALQFPQLTGDSVKSDQLIYDVGFGVLRNSDVTAALTESSFFSNPDEEQRLRTAEHNFLESYGLFDGLARYVYAGLPRQRLVEPADGRIVPGETTSLVFALDDGLRGRKAWGSDRQGILTSSIDVRLDGEPLPWSFENKGYRLTAVVPDDLACGGHRLEVQFVNRHKNSVLNPFTWVDVAGPVADVDAMRIGRKARVDPYLQRRLVEIDRGLCGELGIAVEQRACGVVDLNRGRLAMIRPNAMFYAASVPKIAILLAYFYENPEAATDLDPVIEEELGRMIKQSDNALAAQFSEELGLITIAYVLENRRYRFYDKKRGGGLWMGKHYSKSEERLRDPLKNLSHAATVRQCLRFYLMLEQGRLISPEASARMKGIFASPSLDPVESKFVKGLAGTGATILRKSGTWKDHHLDTALIEHDGRCFILVGLTEHPRGAEYLERLAVEVDRLLVDQDFADE